MLDPGGMSVIRDAFDSAFGSWGITLPEEALASRAAGTIQKKGWCIWYLFGTDEKGEYLDYYSSHRMTEAPHVRLRVGGSAEDLPAGATTAGPLVGMHCTV